MSLNAAQAAAVRTLSGPLLVLAGAGTGKTRVITYRIAELIKHGTHAHRILAVTFTNKAAREMRERAIALLGGARRGTKPPEISTFHSLCVRVLRRHIDKLGYPRQFTIYDQGDQESLARNALRDIRVGTDKLRPGELVAQIGAWKSAGVAPEEAAQIAANGKQELAAAAFARYQVALRAAGAVDFDDLLLCTEKLFTEFSDARVAESSRFDHLLIDEYQDTNGLQYRIVKALAERHRNLCVVGDDDQSIYAWRGAEVAHILSFQRDWPEAKVVRLEENYRSSAPILSLANTLIRCNKARHEKTLRPARGDGPAPRFLRYEDEVKEAESVAREIRQLTDPQNSERVPPSAIAILFRTNEQPRAFELELRRNRIPYVLIGGQSFYDRKEVRDILAYLRVLANPNDEVSLLRIINTPARGIGATTVQDLVQHAVSQGQSLWQSMPQALSSGVVAEHMAKRIEEFRALIEGFRARLGDDKPSKIAGDIIAQTNYKAELERVYAAPGEVDARWDSLEGLVSSVALYEERSDNPSILGFLEETTLQGREDPRDDGDKRQSHAVTLMTLHSAKGLEFPHVYLVGMEEGLLPHKRSIIDGSRGIDEERRLCYVGVTRAQDALTLSFVKARMKWGKLKQSIPSRFLMEMRGETERAARLAEIAAEAFAGVPTGAGGGEEGDDMEAAESEGKAPSESPAGARPKVEKRARTSARKTGATRTRKRA